MIEPLVSLAHSLHSNKGVYALLLGSGLSRAASIPTGWEITLELIRRIAAAEGVEDEITDPEAWFRQAKGEDPDYSRILDTLARTPEERRAVLHGFIAPSPEDVETGIKIPTTAHRAIAALAARGYIRVIITTNFDRLMETALRDAGVEPTVIASPDDASGAVPLMHCTCVVLKLHGDYLDTRIRNSPPELAAYDPRLDTYLDRVFDEFGLIIVGWSGDWDEALRAAIARCPTRRFTTWWAAIGGNLQGRARDLADSRRAQVIPIENADRLFDQLEQKILSLEELNNSHPLSAKLAVAEVKRYIPDPQQRIRLHDLVFGEVRIATNQVSDLTNQDLWSVEEFRRRVSRYESASEILRSLAATGAQWCREEDESLWCEAIRRLCLTCRDGAGFTAWMELRRYLPMLVLFAAGLGATAACRYRFLKRLFELSAPYIENKILLDRFLPATAFRELTQEWELLDAPPGQRHTTPVSDRLNALIKREIPGLAGNDDDFDELFDRLEVLAALSYLNRTVSQDFDINQAIFLPWGRFIWRMQRSEAIRAWLLQADTERESWPPIAAGMFNGSFNRFSQLRTVLNVSCAQRLRR